MYQHQLRKWQSNTRWRCLFLVRHWTPICKRQLYFTTQMRSTPFPRYFDDYDI